MLEGGYIKLYRSLLTWEWYGDVHTKALFLHLLLTANYQRRSWRGITVERGQRVASFTGLARETGLSVQNVKTAVAHLQSTGEVTYRSTRQYSVFTVEQYDRYQGSQPTDQPTDQPAVRPPSTSMEEGKRRKERKRNKGPFLFFFFQRNGTKKGRQGFDPRETQLRHRGAGGAFPFRPAGRADGVLPAEGRTRGGGPAGRPVRGWPVGPGRRDWHGSEYREAGLQPGLPAPAFG